MKKYRIRSLVLAIPLLIPAMLYGQANPSAPAGSARQHNREAPCLKQAGISATTWEEIQNIHKSILQQTSSICQNTSLSTDQKRQQVQGAFQKGQHQIRTLLTPQQQEAFQACQQQRRQERQQAMSNPHPVTHPAEEYRSTQNPARPGLPDPCMRILRQERGPRARGRQPEHQQQQPREPQ